MSDNKRNKKYSKIKDSKKLIILAKNGISARSKKNENKPEETQIQPKILLKTKDKEQTAPCVSSTTPNVQLQNEPKASSQSPNNNINIQSKDKETIHVQSQSQNSCEQIMVPVPIMTRPIFLVSSNYQINFNATKMLMKNNMDFCVIGILGTQGVGKSTIMNLLASDNFDNNYTQIFNGTDTIFPVKYKKSEKRTTTTLPRTDSFNMFITKDRTVLLDCPPVLCNSYKKDATTNELDDIKLIILLLTVCHLVIVVQDEYLNLNLLRLLQFAELAKPNQDLKKSFRDDNTTIPKILFIKNKANREDFCAQQKSKMKQMLKIFFKNSQLQIDFIQNDKMHKGSKQQQRNELMSKFVNYFVFPEIRDDNLTPHHSNVELLLNELRECISMLSRNEMYNANGELLTETSWFELLTTLLNKNHFFLNSYEEIRRSHKDSKGENYPDEN